MRLLIQSHSNWIAQIRTRQDCGASVCDLSQMIAFLGGRVKSRQRGRGESPCGNDQSPGLFCQYWEALLQLQGKLPNGDCLQNHQILQVPTGEYIQGPAEAGDANFGARFCGWARLRFDDSSASRWLGHEHQLSMARRPQYGALPTIRYIYDSLPYHINLTPTLPFF